MCKFVPISSEIPAGQIQIMTQSLQQKLARTEAELSLELDGFPTKHLKSRRCLPFYVDYVVYT